MKNIKEIQHALLNAQDAAHDGLIAWTGQGDPIIRTAFETVYNETAIILEMIEEGLDVNAINEIFEVTHDIDTIAGKSAVKSILRRDKNAEIAMHKVLHYLWEASCYVLL